METVGKLLQKRQYQTLSKKVAKLKNYPPHQKEQVIFSKDGITRKLVAQKSPKILFQRKILSFMPSGLKQGY